MLSAASSVSSSLSKALHETTVPAAVLSRGCVLKAAIAVLSSCLITASALADPAIAPGTVCSPSACLPRRSSE